MTDQEVLQSLAEAPYSWNVRYYDADGFDCMLTIRDVDGKSLFERISAASAWLKEHGASISRGAQPQKGNGGAPPVQPPDAGAGPPPQGDNVDSFPAELLIGSTKGSKVYWKVQGGPFSKFGVTVWPEVLKAAGFTELDPMKEYDLTGYTAVFVRDDEDKPQKVIELRK